MTYVDGILMTELKKKLVIAEYCITDKQLSTCTLNMYTVVYVFIYTKLGACALSNSLYTLALFALHVL